MSETESVILQYRHGLITLEEAVQVLSPAHHSLVRDITIMFMGFALGCFAGTALMAAALQ